MGSSASHFSHGNNDNKHTAPLERVDSSNNNNASETQPTCGVCHGVVNVGTVVYRCPSYAQCSFLLHEPCYRRPKKLKCRHHEHSLTLRATTTNACSICGKQFKAPPAFAYSCTTNGCAGGGFHAHPRCCDLPEDIITGHVHGKLLLRAGGGGDAGGGSTHNGAGEPPRRRCLIHRGQRTAGQQAPPAPWSYQCPTCDKEVCLACLFDADRVKCCWWCVRCCDVTPGAVHCVGQAVGVFLCGLVTGMGCPGSAAPTTWMLRDVNDNSTSHNRR